MSITGNLQGREVGGQGDRAEETFHNPPISKHWIFAPHEQTA